MNIHAPDQEIRDRFKCLEWIGRRWIKDNKTYIKARHKTLGTIFYYCFEDGFAWFPDKN